MEDKNLSPAFEKARNIFLQSNKVTITTHMNPDGDAIGSALAMYHFAKIAGIKAKVIINDKVPYNFKFLPEAENIELYNEAEHNDHISDCDTIFVVDLNDAARLKGMENIIKKSNAKKIVIDHHIDPKDFADAYVVDTDASSAGEIIYKFLSSFDDLKLNTDVAECLYAAIMTDSGNFRFPRTDAELHRIVADLIELGADPVKSYNEIYARMPYRKMKLLGYCYSNMDLHYNGNLCLMYITAEDIQKAEATEEDVEDFVETGLNIEGTKICILMTESRDKSVIRLSFRSKGDISVREIALKFDGGGHFHAAGARVYNSDLTIIRKRILEEVKKAIL